MGIDADNLTLARSGQIERSLPGKAHVEIVNNGQLSGGRTMELRALHASRTDQSCACCDGIIPALAIGYGHYDGEDLIGLICQQCAAGLRWLDLAMVLRTLADALEDMASVDAIA